MNAIKRALSVLVDLFKLFKFFSVHSETIVFSFSGYHNRVIEGYWHIKERKHHNLVTHGDKRQPDSNQLIHAKEAWLGSKTSLVKRYSAARHASRETVKLNYFCTYTHHDFHIKSITTFQSSVITIEYLHSRKAWLRSMRCWKLRPVDMHMSKAVLR